MSENPGTKVDLWDWVIDRDILTLLSNKTTRKILCKNRLDVFAYYYFREFFTFETGDFHRRWYKMALEDKNLLIIGFRGSAKTSILWLIYLIHCICYHSYDFICFYCFDIQKAKSKTMNIANMLKINRYIKEDFWYLYKDLKTDINRAGVDNMQELKKIEEFVTTNGIKVKAMSIWSSPRWELFINAQEVPIRPELIVMDDIDIDKSVKNVQVIDNTEAFITWEVMGWMADNWKIIFLGNIIWEDWVIPRLIKAQSSNEDWFVDDVPLINDKEEIIWKDKYVWTDKEANLINADIPDPKLRKTSLESLLRKQGINAFNSNYRNKPYRIIWNPVFNLDKVAELKVLTPITWFNLTAWWKRSRLQIFNNKYKDEALIVWVDIWGWIKKDYTDITFLNDKKQLMARWRSNEIKFNYIADILTEINDRIGIDFYRNWLVVESNNFWHTVIDRLRDNPYLYSLLYRRKAIWNIRNRTSLSVWWGTDGSSKEIMISDLGVEIDNGDIQIDSTIKSELNSYIQDDDWAYNAQIWCHDDSVISYALAVQWVKSFNI